MYIFSKFNIIFLILLSSFPNQTRHFFEGPPTKSTKIKSLSLYGLLYFQMQLKLQNIYLNKIESFSKILFPYRKLLQEWDLWAHSQELSDECK
jgi:hypothetical protein